MQVWNFTNSSELNSCELSDCIKPAQVKPAQVLPSLWKIPLPQTLAKLELA